MDEDEAEMMEETEVPDNPGDKDNTEGDEERETEEDDPYRCKHYRRKCQFVVSSNWFVYNMSVTPEYVLDCGSIKIGKTQFYLRML